jgi:hypothetical protein
MRVYSELADDVEDVDGILYMPTTQAVIAMLIVSTRTHTFLADIQLEKMDFTISLLMG